MSYSFDAQGFRELREERGLTREAVGVACGRSSETVREWERGPHEPKERVVPLIADLLGVSINELRRRVA